MNTRPKSKLARAAEVLALGLIPFTCVAGLCSIALLASQQGHDGSAPVARRYDMNRFMADARQAAALFHYLTEIEPPVSMQSLAQNCKTPPPPLLTHSNYTLLLTTNKTDPI